LEACGRDAGADRDILASLARPSEATSLASNGPHATTDRLSHGGAKYGERTRVKSQQLFYTSDRKEWRAWLRAHYKSADEVWLVYFKKGSGKPRLSYNDAVEEALCFGWIDSTVRRMDEDRFAQKFSPRKPNSKYSPANKERLRALVARGRVPKTVLATIGDLDFLQGEKLQIAPDILESLKANKVAWKHFRGYSDSYKRIRIGFIEGARHRPAEFRKRLEHFVKMTASDRQFGFGGIDKYY
jgi:uncharacterized protein YdeI (YjbR/CyaY-like superfamily)